MSAAETSVAKTIKVFGGMTKDRLGVLKVRIPEVDRTDSNVDILNEITELGTAHFTEADEKGIQYEVGTTVNPLSHTPIRTKREAFTTIFNAVFHQGDRTLESRVREFIGNYPSMPLHLIIWGFRNHPEIINSTVLPSRGEYPPASDQLYLYIARSTALSVQALDAMLQREHPESANLHLDERIRIYGVLGNTPPDEQSALGLNRGPQSNPNFHIHVAALPANVLEKYAKKEVQVGPEEVLKQMSPFDSLFFAYSSDVIVRKLRQKGIPISAITDHSADESSGRVKFLDGYTINFESPTSLQNSMEIIADIVNEASPVYDTLLQKYTDYYKNLASPSDQERAALECIEVLERYGFRKEEAKKLQQAAFSLAPTYSQIVTLISEVDNRENKDELNKVKERYDKQKELLKPDKRDRTVKIVMKLHGFNEPQARQFLALMEGRLKDTQHGEKAKTTMPGKLSCGYTFNYTLQNGVVEVSAITIATRLSQKNIYEDLVGYELNRD